MRDAAGEFATSHPKIARRLGMLGTETADPHVERLIESFSFMSARLQIKLDAEFPRFTGRLLEVLFPNYTCPTPSMTVLQLRPNLTGDNVNIGQSVPRHTVFKTEMVPGESSACTFRSSQEVMLWPVELVEARLTGAPPDLASVLARQAPGVKVLGALRLRLRLPEAMVFRDIAKMGKLPIYLRGDEQTASRLFELLHSAAVGTATGKPGEMARNPHVVDEAAVVHEGLEADAGLLPLPWNTFHGHNLLHEYFVCPERFWFFTLTQLEKGLAAIDGREAEIVVLLNRAPGDLAALVDADQFALFCTPAINLFPHITCKLKVDAADIEHHYLPEIGSPLDYEVHSVSQLHTPKPAGMAARLTFRPLYQSLHDDLGNHGRYFSLRREPRVASDAVRRHGSRSAYVGSEIFLSLVDQHEAPFAETVGELMVEALVTNRDLPCMLPRNGVSDCSALLGMPVASIGMIRAPTRPRPPYAQQEFAWRLIRQLSFNHLPLADLPQREGAQALRDMLRLFVARDDEVQLRQVESLVGSRIAPVTRRLPGPGPLLYGRGIECTLTIDEAGFSGSSPYLFGLVLERYLARHASVNVFTQTVLETTQRGIIARWPVRAGGRGVV